MTNEERIERVSKNAGLQEKLTYNCAQGTLAALLDEFMPGYEGRAELIKAASVMFGSGMRGETCGAFNGALMFFGVYYGIDNTKVKLTPEKVGEHMKKMGLCKKIGEAFDEKFGSTMCNKISPQILGVFIDDFKDGAVATEKCAVVPEFAAKAVAKIIFDNEDTQK